MIKSFTDLLLLPKFVCMNQNAYIYIHFYTKAWDIMSISQDPWIENHLEISKTAYSPHPYLQKGEKIGF